MSISLWFCTIYKLSLGPHCESNHHRNNNHAVPYVSGLVDNATQSLTMLPNQTGVHSASWWVGERTPQGLLSQCNTCWPSGMWQMAWQQSV